MSNESYINKITALLAKAERSEFPAEAEAFMAKAQQLMTTHAIDEAMIAKARGVIEDIIGADVIVCAQPYATGKAHLLSAICQANDCEAIRLNARGDQHLQVVGHESDIANVKLLFGTLLLHGTREMLRADVPWGDTARAFRHAFLVAYAGRIGERLQDARRAAAASYEAERGTSVALVLVERKAGVARHFKELHPRTRTSGTSVSSGAGMGAGNRAANKADLGGRAVSGQGHKALH